jgi:hypothetical protein
MESKTHARKRTAVETLVLAAASFDREFTKQELAVKAWQIDPVKFGLKGFATLHPDMNRVMMEMVGAKESNPIRRGLIEQVAPSTYRITGKGRATAAATPERGGDLAVARLYQLLAEKIEHPVFLRWKANPSEPETIDVARAFLGTAPISKAREVVELGRDWCRLKGVQWIAWYVPRACRGPIPLANLERQAIGIGDLSDLDDFLTALEYRFPCLKSAPTSTP